MNGHSVVQTAFALLGLNAKQTGGYADLSSDATCPHKLDIIKSELDFFIELG
jgi:hypothetical protein